MRSTIICFTHVGLRKGKKDPNVFNSSSQSVCMPSGMREDAASSENMLKCQIIHPYPRPNELQALGM